MLNYLDGYPMELPCRYSNKQACYTKVYIISTIGFYEQYPTVKVDQSNTWYALKRRIHVFLNFSSEPDPMNYFRESFSRYQS